MVAFAAELAIPPHWVQVVSETWLSRYILASSWLFAVIEAFHLLGLAVFGGSLVAVDISVLGVGFPSKDIHLLRVLRAKTTPWMAGGLILLLFTGVLMFFDEPAKCYFNPAFRFKMICLALGLLVLMTLRRRALNNLMPTADRMPIGLKVISVLSLALFLGVAVGGRAIGFY